MTTRATNSEVIRLMAMVIGKSCRKSPFCPVQVSNNGKKMALIQAVASSIGMK